MLRLLAFTILYAGCSVAIAARPPMLVPASPGVVLERLPAGYAALAPRARALPPLANARRLLSTAASSGDARLAARAEALLQRLPAAQGRSPEALHLRAHAAQHRHDFAAALGLLDALLAQSPRDAEARLARAQLQLVQGRIPAARADCAALALGIDAAQGLLCAAALSLRLGRHDVAAMLSERWLASAPTGDERRRYALLLRAEAGARAGASADADAWYRQALAGGEQDVRVLAAFSRHLRRTQRPVEAWQLLAAAPASDSLQLERALAAWAAGRPESAALAAEQGRRYALARRLGSVPELRDEAEYHLSLRGDAGAALMLAQRNFTSQRDREDVELLERAARAARRPEALRELRAWLRSQGLGADASGP